MRSSRRAMILMTHRPPLPTAHPAARHVPAVPAQQARRCSFTPPAEPDIDAIAYGFMASQALFTGLELGLFDLIAEGGGLSIEGIAAATKVNDPRLQTLLNVLASHGVLRRADDGVYTCSDSASKFLVQSSKMYYGDYLRYQVGRQFYGKMGNLTDIMTTGEAPTYAQWFSDASEARMYTQAQHNGSLATAKGMLRKVDMSGVRDFLDVGGGSGAFSIVICRRNPEIRAQVIELPEVAKTGMEFVSKEDPAVAARIKYHSGTALDDWGLPAESQDCVLMSYLSGSVPESLLVPLYRQAHKTLRPGGRLIVHDFMVNDDLRGPPIAAGWALAHVTVNSKGLGLSPAGVAERMRTGGFSNVAEHQEMIGGLTKVLVATK